LLTTNQILVYLVDASSVLTKALNVAIRDKAVVNQLFQ
jgi:hypothetical protein